MFELMNKLNGFKTYITAGTMIMTGLGMVMTALSGTGDGEIVAGVTMIFNGFGLLGLRHGVEKLGDSIPVYKEDDNTPVFDDNGVEVADKVAVEVAKKTEVK